MNMLDKIFADHSTPATYSRAYLNHLVQLLNNLDADAIGKMIELFISARENGNQIFFCGNGGSAATASHFANDIAIGTRCPEKPFKAVSLTDNMPVITAIANDYGYDHIFVKQLEILFNEGDIVVAISASGNSQNVVNALEYANQNGGHSVAVTGFSGGKIKEIAHSFVHVETSKGEYGPVEDIHMILDHVIGTYLMRI